MEKELEQLEAYAALISAFAYYFSWFSIQSFVDMKMGAFPALVSGLAMGVCMSITLGGAFAKGSKHGILLRVIFGACSMGIGPLMEWIVKKEIAKGNRFLSGWNHELSVSYLSVFSRNSCSSLFVVLTWLVTVGVISALCP